MSPIQQASKNSSKCYNQEPIRDAYCKSQILFHKENTCSFPPMEQTCYVNKEMKDVNVAGSGCYNGYYYRCHLNDYEKHAKDNNCVSAESAKLEWCTCVESPNANAGSTGTMIEKDCTCFPFRVKPYEIQNVKEVEGDPTTTTTTTTATTTTTTTTHDACICSNIQRRKCTFPRRSIVQNEKINCVAVSEILPMEEDMKCLEFADTDKILSEHVKAKYSKHFISHWSQLNRRDAEANSPESTESHEEKDMNPTASSLSEIKKKRKRRHNGRASHMKPSSSVQNIDSLFMDKQTVERVEESLEIDIEKTLKEILGNPYFENEKKIEEDLHKDKHAHRKSLSNNQKGQMKTMELTRRAHGDVLANPYLSQMHTGHVPGLVSHHSNNIRDINSLGLGPNMLYISFCFMFILFIALGRFLMSQMSRKNKHYTDEESAMKKKQS